MQPILEVKNLHVSFDTYAGAVRAVRGVDFHINKGETLAIVGESGSGKSITSKSIMRLIPSRPGQIVTGDILFEGKNMTALPEKEMQKIRGAKIAMIFQDPMSSLNPTMTIGYQVSEGLIKHQKLSKKEAKQQVIELLKSVGISNPEMRVSQYPHQFSGGMRQRVMIAMALACNPKLLIADEPTTALDVTIQAQILDVLKAFQAKSDAAIILITHDLGVVANIAHRVAVMYAGIIIETGTVDEIFYRSKHPYTWSLLASMPKLHTKKGELLAIRGTPPDLLSPPQGCPFATRCSYVMEVCLNYMPKSTKLSDTQITACWLQDERTPKAIRPNEKMGGPSAC